MAPVPVYVKGGIWTNLEDQIVKAAIQKYGTHQWSKIASLLQKKSAKQCEIRWNEFLNPKINFNEFTKEEDTKLLDLARKLPNQWRSIADAMGRTAQICIDRYNNLLEGDDDDTELRLGSSIDFKVGDLNPKSETLVAKPDDIELADDEREMLAEARARLLNTQGKKATRKIRERMLEESKRIAQLQKRRELKQAGVRTSIRPNRKKYSTELDYNADVVYEQAPPPGIYDTSKEDERLAKEFDKFQTKVERKGLRDKSNFKHDSSRDIKIRKDRDETATSVQPGERSVLINDYKKPVLSLPKPGTKRSVETNDIESKRRKLLENSLTGAVFKTEKQEVPTTFETIISEDHNVDGSENFVNAKSLQELFALLPKPKNDFEIAIDEDEDEDEDEDAEEQDHHASSNETPDGQDMQDHEEPNRNSSTENLISLELDCLKARGLPLPSFLEDPQNAFDQTFNELIACSMLNEPYNQNADVQNSIRAVEDELQIKVPATVAFELPEPELPSRTNLLESIKARIASIKHLQNDLVYIKPMMDRNEAVSLNVCGIQLPRIRSLQHRYFVNYRMYQNESDGILRRKERLQRDIDSTLDRQA